MRAHELHEFQFRKFKDYVERSPRSFEKAIETRRARAFPEGGEEKRPKQRTCTTLLCQCEVISL